MSKFYGTLKGSGKIVTKRGHETTGLTVTAETLEKIVRVDIFPNSACTVELREKMVSI